MTVKQTIWRNCYKPGGWKGIITNESYKHPARFAYGLISRIILHGLDQQFWAPDSLVIDPFAGVGCGGVIAAYTGLRFWDLELEPHFVDLAEANFALHRRKWEAMGLLWAVVPLLWSDWLFGGRDKKETW